MKGHCLCGAVTVTAQSAKAPHPHADACHCSMCRRWSSGPFFATEGKDVQIEGKDAVTEYASSEWARRAFCKHCGTHLYYLFLQTQGYMLSAGLFQENADFAFTTEIYIDKKPDWYAFANPTKTMTEAEVLKAFGFAPDGN